MLKLEWQPRLFAPSSSRGDSRSLRPPSGASFLQRTPAVPFKDGPVARRAHRLPFWVTSLEGAKQHPPVATLAPPGLDRCTCR